MMKLHGVDHCHFASMAVEQSHLQIPIQGQPLTVALRSQVSLSGHDSNKRCQSSAEELEHFPEPLTNLGIPDSHSHNKQGQTEPSAGCFTFGKRSPLR